MMSDASPITSPKRIAGYAVQCELAPEQTFLAEGRGGRRVVLKRLEEDCLLGGQLHPHIHDRLSRVRELAHVGVANLIGVEADGDEAYLVWEYVEGTPMAAASWPADAARRRGAVARELIAHVETLHALGIVHGEIHGKNVIVTTAGRLRLTHVSPLLYNEPRADVDAVAKLLREIGIDAGERPETLRQIAARIGVDARGGASNDAGASTPDAAPGGDDAAQDQRGSLLAAAVVAFAAAAIALGVWYWTSRVGPIEEPAPASRAAAERGGAS